MTSGLALLLLMPLGFLRPEEIPALLVVFCTFPVIFVFREMRKPGIAWAAFAVWLSHAVVALINALVTTTPGAALDALTFHLVAVDLSAGIESSYLSAHFYVRLLALLYRLLTPSLLIGESISLLATSLTLILIVKISRRLGSAQFAAGLVLMSGMLPSVVLFSSITLREGLQMFAVTGMVFGALRMRAGRRVTGLLILAASGILAGLLHHGLAAFAVLLTGIAVYWTARERLRRLPWKKIAALMFAVLFVLLMRMQSVIDVMRTRNMMGGAAAVLLEGNYLEAVGSYRMRAASVDARANYGIVIDPSRPDLLIVQIPLIIVYYLFAPLPWQVSSPMDALAFLESVLRLFLFASAFRQWRIARGELRSQLGFIFLSLLLLEMLWAAGTQNWGTALRHRVPAYPLLVLVGGPRLIYLSRRMLSYVVGSPLQSAPGERWRVTTRVRT